MKDWVSNTLCLVLFLIAAKTPIKSRKFRVHISLIIYEYKSIVVSMVDILTSRAVDTFKKPFTHSSNTDMLLDL